MSHDEGEDALPMFLIHWGGSAHGARAYLW